MIAILHGMILTPALLGECSFIYSGISEEQQDRTSKNADDIKAGDVAMARKDTNASSFVESVAESSSDENSSEPEIAGSVETKDTATTWDT